MLWPDSVNEKYWTPETLKLTSLSFSVAACAADAMESIAAPSIAIVEEKRITILLSAD